MNPALKEAILESCRESVRLLHEGKMYEAIRALKEANALMALDRRIETTTMLLEHGPVFP